MEIKWISVYKVLRIVPSTLNIIEVCVENMNQAGIRRKPAEGQNGVPCEWMKRRKGPRWGAGVVWNKTCVAFIIQPRLPPTVVWLLGRSQLSERSPFCLHPLDQSWGRWGNTPQRMLGHTGLWPPWTLSAESSLLRPAALSSLPEKLLAPGLALGFHPFPLNPEPLAQPRTFSHFPLSRVE